MSIYRASTIAAVLGVVIALVAFLINYHFVSFSVLGYEVLVGPAIFALSFFSEETAFIPKMIIFLFGQFVGYFTVTFISCKLVRAKVI